MWASGRRHTPTDSCFPASTSHLFAVRDIPQQQGQKEGWVGECLELGLFRQGAGNGRRVCGGILIPSMPSSQGNQEGNHCHDLKLPLYPHQRTGPWNKGGR